MTDSMDGLVQPKLGLLITEQKSSRGAYFFSFTLLHSERPKLYTILAFLSAT